MTHRLLVVFALVTLLAGYASGDEADFSEKRPSAAQTRSKQVLLPEALLESSKTRFPEILESIARERGARAGVLTADGAFDLVFNAEGFDRVTGFWTGAVAETEVRQNLRNYGASVYGGYRISDGTFPIYEDINFTNTGGEFKVGTVFSLLRDRTIDSRRFQVLDARLVQSQASLDVTLTRVGVQQRALNAYWRWIAAGRELDVYRNLLFIADEREAGLEEQVRKGALPEVAVIENLQNITRRKILLAEAERNFQVAANTLSFYLRDRAGEPVMPGADQLPDMSMLAPLGLDTDFQPADISGVLAARPELRTLRLAVERARNQILLSENNLKPKLDLNVEVSRDLGEIAEGGISRDSTDTIIGFKFSVPLQRREARGRLAKAQAEMRETKLREQRIEEQIEIEVRNILINLGTALQLASLASSDVDQTQAMVNAEQRRFALGASDFFLVNVREERAADAQIRQIRADLNGRLAQTSYAAATIDMASLGLS